MNHLPGKLVRLRKHYNYSQGQIAEVLGIDALEYMAYENGRAVLNYAQMKKLSAFYHVSIDDLFRNSEEIELKSVSSTDTDELNLKYFIPKKTVWTRTWNLLKKYPYVFIGAFLLVSILIGLSIMRRPVKDPDSLELQDRNRLSVSESSVVWIMDDGSVKGSGDDSYGQLEGLPESGILKVAEGQGFTVVLGSEGRLATYGGMTPKMIEEISSWKNITDIAAGESHLVAVDSRGRVMCIGDDSNGQCEISSVSNIERVYASDKGSIAISRDGKIFSSGDFFGASMFKNFTDIRDIASSSENTVIVREDGSVRYYAKNRSFFEAETWSDIVDVACGNNFIAGLDSNGKVHIDIDSYIIRTEVESWENIKAIDADDEYLIAFDGEKIYGIGKNTYHQFEKSESLKTTLAQVSGVNLNMSEDAVTVRFDPVANASGYVVSIDAGIGLSQYIRNEEVSFSADNFTEQASYTLTIITKGEDDYEDSAPLVYNFTYVPYVPPQEDVFTLDELIGKTVTNFEAYLKGLDYDITRLTRVETEEICEGEEAIVTGVSGIYEHESIRKSELQQRQITYSYCKVVPNGEE
ncbi:MAG: helix-turn-helix domain-containing protein [Erysipelotrichaceae bacterium]|nr:helix-turn-helix domain-containing protein [Erysipelotrichaceae bacterium]